MANVNSHSLRMPPDSTGKRIRVTHFIEVPYTGMSTLLEAGDHISIKRLGATITHGFCLFVRDSAGTGIMGLAAHTDHQSPVTGILAGDTIERQESSGYVLRATAIGPDVEYFVNTVQAVSIDNPFYGQKIDQYGAAFTRFTEGGVTFDGTGRMRQTNNINIQALEFHDLQPYHFSTMVEQGGTVTHNDIQQAAVLNTTGVTGDNVHFIANKNLFHEANASLFADTTIRVGDTGKANVIRRWGLWNEEDTDGIYFQLSGTTLTLNIVNSTSGSPVITSVSQSSFSEDGLGIGTANPSGLKLDVSKANSYWFEIVQDGAGFARAGVFNEKGVRIVCHIFEGNNVTTTGFMATGSFPFHYEQLDSGGGSASQMFIYSCSAELEGPSTVVNGSFFEGCSDPVAVNSMGAWVPIFSIRPKVYEADGITPNRNILMPKLISIDVTDDADRITPRRIKLEVFRNTSLTSAVWAKTKGNAQTDYVATLSDGLGATAQTGGTAIAEWIVRGNRDLDIGALFDYTNTYLCNNADGTQNQLTIAAKTLDPGVTVNIVCALTWEEVDSH